MGDTIITNDGRQIPISHMEMEHILRCVKRIQRRAEYLERLALELTIRKITRRT